MKKTLLLFFALSMISLGYGQTSFYRLFGGSEYDEARDVVETADSGFLMTGVSSSFGTGGSDAFLLKIDKFGNYQWSVPYGGPENDGALEMEYIENHGIYLVGRSNSLNGGYDSWLSFIDETGSEIWSKTYPGENWEEIVDASLTRDSGLVIGIHNMGDGTLDQDVSILRLDANGDTLWAQDFMSPGMDEITNIEPYQDSFFVISSVHLDTVTDYRFTRLRMLDEAGGVVWEDTVGIYPKVTRLSDFILINDTLLGVGENIDNDTLNGDIYRLIYDVSIGNNHAISNSSSNSGDYFVADVLTNVEGSQYRYMSLRFKGEFTQAPGNDSYFALYQGDLVWLSSFDYTDTPGDDRMYEVIATKDGGVIYVGYQAVGAGGQAIAVAKIGPNFDHPDILGVTFVNQLVNTEELSLEDALSVYPNPSTYDFTIDIIDSKINQFELTDVHGNTINSGVLSKGGNIVSVEGVASGMYVLLFKSDNHLVGSKRLLVR